MKARLLNQRLTGLAALLAALTLLAGCAFSSSDSGDEEPEESQGGDGPVSLTFQSLAFQEPTVKATEEIVDAWNQANPDIQVELVQGTWDGVHDQLVTQFQGGTAPDVIHYEAAGMSGFARQGFLADLSPNLADEVTADVSDSVWDSVTVDGQVIAVPTLIQTYVVFANTTLLEEAGVALPQGDTLSWDDLAATAKQLTTDGRYGLGWGLKSPVATMMSLAPNFGGEFFATDGDQATIQIGEAEQEVPRRIHEMAYTDKSIDPTTLTQSGSDVLPGFFDGRYAMIVAGSYIAQQLAEKAPEGFEWAVLPPLSGSTAEQASSPQTLSVSAASDHVEEATEFLNFVMQADNLAALAEGDWLIPASASAREAVAEATGGENGWAQTLASGEQVITAPYQTVDAYPQWKDQIATPALQEYLADRIDLETFTSRLTDGWAQVSG